MDCPDQPGDGFAWWEVEKEHRAHREDTEFTEKLCALCVCAFFVPSVLKSLLIDPVQPAHFISYPSLFFSTYSKAVA
jgi:hypothetical protein